MIEVNELNNDYSLCIHDIVSCVLHFPFSLVSMALQASQHRAMSMDKRKRPYHSMKADQCQEPTEEEMEAFRLKRKRTEDPMADFLKR